MSQPTQVVGRREKNACSPRDCVWRFAANIMSTTDGCSATQCV